MISRLGRAAADLLGRPRSAVLGHGLLPVVAALGLAAGPPAAALGTGLPPIGAAGVLGPAGGVPVTTGAAFANGISLDQDQRLPPMPPPGLRAETRGGRIVISWDPVGLQILTAYRVVRLEPTGSAHLGDVPADVSRELARAGRYTFTVPGPPPAGILVYAVSTLDRYGNESAPVRVKLDVP